MSSLDLEQVLELTVPVTWKSLRDNSIRPIARLLDQRLIRPLLRIEDTAESVAMGVAVGLFIALTPTVGIQMFLMLAIGTALIWCGIPCNRLAGVIMCWVSNPFTFIPMYYTDYRLGALLLQQPVISYYEFQSKIPAEGSWSEILSAVAQVGIVDLGIPMWLGSLVLATTISIPSYPITLRFLRRAQTRLSKLKKLLGKRKEKQTLRLLRHTQRRDQILDPANRWRQRRIILASQSPMRKKLLEKIQDPIECIPAHLEEKLPRRPGRRLKRALRTLAVAKAKNVARHISAPDALLFAGDTVVIHGNQILGKPSSPQEVRTMLDRLAGTAHEVWTALAILDTATGRHLSGIRSASVHLRTLAPEEITLWSSRSRALQVAGGYHLDELNIPSHVERIDGDLDTVLGLPSELLYDLLARLEVDTPH